MSKELKISRYEIELHLNPLLSNIKVIGINNEDKMMLLELKMLLTDIIHNMQEYYKMTADKVNKPDNFTELYNKVISQNATEQEKEEWNKMYADCYKKFEELIHDYINTSEIIPFNFISKESFQRLMDSNDFKLVEYEYIYKTLVK